MILKKIIGEIGDDDLRRPSVIALLLANLVPVFGVVMFGWEVFPLLFLFWFENVIVGALNVLKMLCAAPREPVLWLGKIFLVPFFCFHYGMFTFVHGVFVLGFFGKQFARGLPEPTPGHVLQIIRENHLGWAIVGLAVSHAISFATNYVGRGEFRRTNPLALMQQPYSRVVVLHLTIIFGGFLMLALRSPVVGLILLVALKTALDLRSHVRERKQFSAESPKTDAARKNAETNVRTI